IVYAITRRFFLFFLFLLFLPVCVFAQEFQTVQDGIEHAKFTRKIKDEPVVVNLLRLDLSKVRLDVVHAMDAAIGTETTSSIATRHGAIAAINAGFFRLDRSIFAGDATGVLMIDNVLLSESYQKRVALFINNESQRTTVEFDQPKFLPFFVTDKNTEINVALNRERKTDDVIVYTPEFGRTTLTDGSGIEVVVKTGRISQIIEGKGSSLIPRDGFVISAGSQKRDEILKIVRLKAKTFLSYAVSTKIKEPYQDVVSGVPQLIKNGQIEITWEQEKSSKAFVETRHPRTAVAKLKDGKFLMITVDGRQPGVSVGMNLNELAEMLLELGATDAMNLDGGGSTAMFLDGKIVNKPSDKEGERKVSDAILVTPRKKK
ncbi:MAG: copper amine oxidase domain protein, partial [Acidobacteria bacterium]|nr:copper amine oxidase domain protein [Acidobacteriota bacterium]